MDTITNMRSLVTVARYGSFSAAARELSLSTAMVSKHVKQLEERLDVRLLNRTTRGVSLTEPGALYCQYATDILDKVQECNDAVQTLNTKPRGALRISCPPSFGEHVLTHGLSQYIRENPEISVMSILLCRNLKARCPQVVFDALQEMKSNGDKDEREAARTVLDWLLEKQPQLQSDGAGN